MQLKDDGDLHRGNRSTDVTYNKRRSMTIQLGQKNRWCKFRIIRGQRSIGVTYDKLSSMAVELSQITDDDDDLHRGQRSTYVKQGTPKIIEVIQGHFKVKPKNWWEGHPRSFQGHTWKFLGSSLQGHISKIRGYTCNLQIFENKVR